MNGSNNGGLNGVRRANRMGRAGLYGGTVMLLALAIAPLGWEDSSSSSGGVTPCKQTFAPTAANMCPTVVPSP